MNTPAHLLVGATAFGRDHKTVWAAVFGALLPDLSLYLLVFNALVLQGIPDSVVFNELYFSDEWQLIFAVDNSFLLWGAILAIGLLANKRWVQALAGSGLLHIASDFLLHHDDGRRHFWPLSDWVFASPVSYWDSSHHATWIGPLLALLALCCVVILWRRFPLWRARLPFAALLLAEMNTLRSWFLYF